MLVPAGTILAQSGGYQLLPAPDLWYNDVDGIRLGINLKGQVPGTFDDGPHRLDAGFWVGLWFPDTPVSYYLSYTEPVPAISDFGSEGNIQFISSIRTGYHKHGIALNKRWQQGFDERRFREVSLFQFYEKRFDLEYTPFPVLWSEDDKWLIGGSFEIQSDNSLGWFNLQTSGSVQVLDDIYANWTIEGVQNIEINQFWGFRFRAFSGVAGDKAAPEYLFSRSGGQAVTLMDSGFTRAKGTIPSPWLNSGKIHRTGGANLRGYTNRDIQSYKIEDESEEAFLLNSVLSVNSEFDFWNPIQKLISDNSFLSDFLSLRTYLFFDAGQSIGISGDDTDQLFADAGTGVSLSFNIPNNLGKPRGFVLRYEMPFWLNEPVPGEDTFKFRYLIGLGAVISF